MKKAAISTKTAPQAIGPYSQGIASEDWIFTAGQIPLDASGKMVSGGIKEQTEQVLRNLGEILRAAGAGYADVVKTTVFMKDLSGFAEMNEVYGKYFPAPCPARSTVQVGALPKDALVEIEVVARRPG